MNNEQDILLRQSKWSGRRVVLFYWFAIAFMGTAVAIGLGSSVLEPTFKFEQVDHSAYGITEPWHPEDCSPCHNDVIATWNDTWHSDFVGVKLVVNETHVIRYPNNPMMPPSVYTIEEFAAGGGCCMVTRWENTTEGAILNGTFWDYGITCAACHPNPGEVNENPMTCFQCHVPGGNQYLNWLKSSHASSLDDLLASPAASSYCLHCMAGQATYMNLTGVDPEDPSLSNIWCATCHDPHDASINAAEESTTMGPNGHQLRAATTNELCGTCHTQYEFLTSTDPVGPHNGTLSCTDCHGYRWIPEHNSTDRFGNPIVVPAAFASINHTWEFSPFPEACGLCHGSENATVYATMQTYIGEVDDLVTLYNTKLTNVTAKVNEANETKGIDQTEVDNAYDLLDEADDLADAYDTAFHNPELAKQKLQLALTKLDQAYTIAVEAMDNAKSSPGFDWILALPIVAFLGVILRKKRR